jgi:gamma-glutamyltranspeptidase/glutathione hydrolase
MAAEAVLCLFVVIAIPVEYGDTGASPVEIMNKPGKSHAGFTVGRHGKRRTTRVEHSRETLVSNASTLRFHAVGELGQERNFVARGGGISGRWVASEPLISMDCTAGKRRAARQNRLVPPHEDQAMRDFSRPSRSVALGTRGMIATSNPQAALAGLDVLRRGGNAVDAAVTAAAMLAVVEPSQTGIGGDCFVLLKKPGRPPIALNGSGWSPAGASAARLRDLGMHAIDPQAADAVTVPGAVRAWQRLLADYGTRSLGDALEPAIVAAKEGYPVTERLARDWARQIDKLSACADTQAIFLRQGKAPRMGDMHANARLAYALAAIAREGAEVFYSGWIAEDITRFLKSRGGTMTVDDMAAYRPEYVAPITTAYRGYQLWECPPNGQGVVALQLAAMQQAFDMARYGPLSAERYHLHAELSRLAYNQRDAILGDPGFSPVDVHGLLAPGTISSLVSRVDADRRMTGLPPAPVPAHRDTVYIAAVDQNGVMVSFINSLFDDFGSGLTAPKSGILLHNRGCGFVLDAGHPNELRGRKRPMHTIIPALLTQKDHAVMAFGVTGGHFQPSGQIQVLSNILDHGMGIQQAIEHPRLFARGETLELESTVPARVWSGLRERGHHPALAANPLGTCHAIWADQAAGVYLGGSDSRRDGLALGY